MSLYQSGVYRIDHDEMEEYHNLWSGRTFGCYCALVTAAHDTAESQSGGKKHVQAGAGVCPLHDGRHEVGMPLGQPLDCAWQQ